MNRKPQEMEPLRGATDGSLATGQGAPAFKWPVLRQELGASAGRLLGELGEERRVVQPIALGEQIAHVVLIGRGIQRADLA